jgi:hypothetical protein
MNEKFIRFNFNFHSGSGSDFLRAEIETESRRMAKVTTPMPALDKQLTGVALIDFNRIFFF